MSDVTSLGVAMAAGMAAGVEVWQENEGPRSEESGRVFTPSTTYEGKPLDPIPLWVIIIDYLFLIIYLY